MTPENIARVAYEVNAAYCRSMGDNSFSSWDQAPEWQKNTNIDGVKFITNNPDAGPDASHNNWLKVKENEGWKYGSVKDPVKKEHPCFLPYDQLPPEQKAKDFIFGAVVRSLLAYADANQNTGVPKEPTSPLTANQSSIADATTITADGKLETDLSKLTAKPV